MLTRDWEFAVLGIHDYRDPASPLRNYFRFIREYHDRLEGDVAEAGVFRGGTLLAAALLLKEVGSEKRVIGFDSFSGFPPVYHANDQPGTFERLFREGRIAADHLRDVRRNRELLELGDRTASAPDTASTSGDFSGTGEDLLRRKIAFLGLDNVELRAGPFEATMTDDAGPAAIMAGNIDCDLYESYRVALPFFWDRLVVGGYLHLDEYYSLKFPGPRVAVDEFFRGRRDRPIRHATPPSEFERWGVQKLEAGQS